MILINGSAAGTVYVYIYIYEWTKSLYIYKYYSSRRAKLKERFEKKTKMLFN